MFRIPNSAFRIPPVLWPSGEGSSLTRRRSVVRVHPGSLWTQSTRHRSPTAEAVVSKATECEFESHRCYSTEKICPRRAAWSARHPVTVEIVGSNPIGGAENSKRRGSPTAEASGLSPECCGFESHPRYLSSSKPKRLGAHLGVGPACRADRGEFDSRAGR